MKTTAELFCPFLVRNSAFDLSRTQKKPSLSLSLSRDSHRWLLPRQLLVPSEYKCGSTQHAIIPPDPLSYAKFPPFHSFLLVLEESRPSQVRAAVQLRRGEGGRERERGKERGWKIVTPAAAVTLQFLSGRSSSSRLGQVIPWLFYVSSSCAVLLTCWFVFFVGDFAFSFVGTCGRVQYWLVGNFGLTRLNEEQNLECCSLGKQSGTSCDVIVCLRWNCG